MPRSALETEEASHAQMEAVRGAGVGALKWGAASALLGGLGQIMSPIYRGLTIQFKLCVSMSIFNSFIYLCWMSHVGLRWDTDISKCLA